MVNIVLPVISVQLQTCTVAHLYAKPSSRSVLCRYIRITEDPVGRTHPAHGQICIWREK